MTTPPHPDPLPKGEGEPPNASSPHPPEKLTYEPVGYFHKTPRILRIIIWIAIGVHAIGIIPAIILFWHAANDESSTFGQTIWSGACCCPMVGVVIVGLFALLMRKADES